MPGDGLVGVDEAGKGPVLGSMFAAAVRVPDRAVLPEGLDDSKRLSPDHRESLARKLREHPEIAVGVYEVTVERIDDPGTDMNRLTVTAHASAAGQILADGDRILADACDTNEARFADRLGRQLDSDPAVRAEHATLDAEHGADETHAVVAAASIVAKVRRDAHVAELADRHGELGSGYPSDPTTKEFLEAYVDEHGTVPPCARESWSTCEKLLAAREQAGLGEF